MLDLDVIKGFQSVLLHGANRWKWTKCESCIWYKWWLVPGYMAWKETTTVGTVSVNFFKVFINMNIFFITPLTCRHMHKCVVVIGSPRKKTLALELDVFHCHHMRRCVELKINKLVSLKFHNKFDFVRLVPSKFPIAKPARKKITLPVNFLMLFQCRFMINPLPTKMIQKWKGSQSLFQRDNDTKDRLMPSDIASFLLLCWQKGRFESMTFKIAWFFHKSYTYQVFFASLSLKNVAPANLKCAVNRWKTRVISAGTDMNGVSLVHHISLKSTVTYLFN